MVATVTAPMIKDLQRGLAFLKSALANPVGVQGRTMTALAETALPFNNSRWFWTDDNAKALELLALPQAWDADPGFGRAILDFVLAMSPEDMIWRRAAEPMLRLHSADPKALLLVTPFHTFEGDLSRGLLRQSNRSNDGRTRAAVEHTGNLLEFRLGGRKHCIDVEDSIVDCGIQRGADGVTLFHESEIVVPPALLRRQARTVGRLRYEYLASAQDPVLRLRVSLRPGPGIRLSHVRLTTALDRLADRPRVLAVGEGATAVTAGDHAPGVRKFAADTPAGFTLAETGQPGFAAALHIRPLGDAKPAGIAGTWAEDRRLNWLVARYRHDDPPAGETISVEEARLLTVGGGLGAAAAMGRRIAEGWTPQGIDPSGSYDHGVELNAVAMVCLHAAAGAYERPIGDDEQARLRQWFDRHLAAYFASLAPAEAPAATAVFVRGLAFTIIALDCMLRAKAPGDYALHLGAGLDLLLATQGSGDDDGVFRDTGAGQSFLDCHAAGILALARLARRGADDRVAPALRRALLALRFGTVAVPLGDASLPVDTIVVRSTRPDGHWTEDGAIWSYKSGLLLRALQAVMAAIAAGGMDLPEPEQARVRGMIRVCAQHLETVRRERAEGPEFLTSTFSAETNSETQPWVLLGLAAPDRALPDLRDSA